MGDTNISRFCELVSFINKMNDDLITKRYHFYDGGHTFEECYELDIKQLIEYQNELKKLLITITSI